MMTTVDRCPGWFIQEWGTGCAKIDLAPLENPRMSRKRARRVESLVVSVPPYRTRPRFRVGDGVWVWPMPDEQWRRTTVSGVFWVHSKRVWAYHVGMFTFMLYLADRLRTDFEMVRPLLMQ